MPTGCRCNTFASALSGDTILLDVAGKGNIVITDALTIQGPGANNLSLSGGNVASSTDGGILRVTASTLTVSGITLTDGNTTGRGGALGFDSFGSLTLSNVAIQNSFAQTCGGGLYKTSGNLTVTHSTISGNSTGGSGGGFCSNYATVSLLDSTVTGNSAGSLGGGFYVRAGLTVNNSTITGNGAGNGGGFYLEKFDGVLKNSIVAHNTAGAGQEFYVESQGSPNNVTANNCLFAGSYFLNSGALSGSNNIFDQDPKLASLAYNGGPTKTLALLPGSPAIAAADNSTCETTDQRGVARPSNGTCDIGAYEFDELFFGNFESN
jgi:hypothetical protein